MPGTERDDRDAALIEARFDASLRACSGEVTELDGGFAVRTRELPLVWTLNQIRLHRHLDLDELAGLADALQGDLPFRHVVARPGAVDASVEAAALAQGWQVEHDVVMALHGRAAQPADPRIVELTEDQMLELMAAWLLEELPTTTPEGLAQVLEYNRREGRHFGEQRLGVLDEAGRPAAVTKVRIAEAFGWVEDVYVRPDLRGRGAGRALVSRAADLALAAGCELVAIVADADDWPQHLYAEVGFRPLARATIYHQRRDADDAAN